jgi:hypothetical protein
MNLERFNLQQMYLGKLLSKQMGPEFKLLQIHL